jgi:hypothetical protein
VRCLKALAGALFFHCVPGGDVHLICGWPVGYARYLAATLSMPPYAFSSRDSSLAEGGVSILPLRI